MRERYTSKDGTSFLLTGDQVKFIRTVMGESQAEFGRRIAVSGASVHRLEMKQNEASTGPSIILISMIAEAYSIAVPEHVLRRPEVQAAE